MTWSVLLRVTHGSSRSNIRQAWMPATPPALSNRPLFNSTAGAGNQIDNLTGGKAQFTIVTASQLVVRGAALASDQLKGSTNGVLASASRFAVDRTLLNGDNFELGYRVTLNAV